MKFFKGNQFGKVNPASEGYLIFWETYLTLMPKDFPVITPGKTNKEK